MSTIYLDEQGSEVKKKGELLIIEKDDKTIAEIPLAQLDRMVIIGNIQITTPALALLLDNEIPVSFITTYGNYRGKLKPPTHKNIMLRLKQYECYNNKTFRLNHSKEIIRAKLKNGKTFLQKHWRNNPEIEINQEIKGIEAALRRLDNVESIKEIMGLEGMAAKGYFSAFGKLVKKEFKFEKRTRRPPKDPVNALLSLGYTLLYNELLSAVEAIGFDPYLGFFHEIEYGRPSMAVDMMEEFRFLIEGLALTLINKEILSLENFIEQDNGGFYLNEKGREEFYHHYEKRITTEVQYPISSSPLGGEGQSLPRTCSGGEGKNVNYRRIFCYQVERLARVVKGEVERYIGYETR
ncbi:MAG: CRISPR-associated endonuclease Cas1 [Nitrospinota bacterium]